MATERDVWQAIRLADLPDDRPYEVVPTPPGPWSPHLWLEVYVPGKRGHNRSRIVTEADTVETLVVAIHAMTEEVLRSLNN